MQLGDVKLVCVTRSNFTQRDLRHTRPKVAKYQVTRDTQIVHRSGAHFVGILEALKTQLGGELGQEELPATYVDKAIEDLGLKQISDSSELEKIIDDVLAANAKNVEEIRAGNTKAMNALVGQAMKATKGKANPAQVNELLKKKIG